MAKNSDIPKQPDVMPMMDTDYTSYARKLSNAGAQGMLDNYQNVNVFSPELQAEFAKNANDIYAIAESDFDKNYRNTMNAYDRQQYGQFGTLGATPSLYNRDMYNLEQQRKIADLSYRKALYSEDLKNNELARRYNYLNSLSNMYKYGSIPYELDTNNWNILNENNQNRWQGDVAQWKADQQSGANNANSIGSILGTIGGIALAPATLGQSIPIGASLGSSLGGMYAQYAYPSATSNSSSLLNSNVLSGLANTFKNTGTWSNWANQFDTSGLFNSIINPNILSGGSAPTSLSSGTTIIT